MKHNLRIYIKTDTVFNSKISYLDNGAINYTITMPLDEYADKEIEKLRGCEWNDIPQVIVDRNAIKDRNKLDLLNRLIEVITIGYGYKPIHTSITNTTVLEKIICNNYPTIKTYFYQLPQLKNGETNFWYLASSKDGIKVGIDKYEQALREYTRDSTWHLSKTTEFDKQHVVYKFTNMYDDLYY